MTLEAKTTNARQLIARCLARCRWPVTMCSFGKDSMVLLHLVRGVRPDVPVLFHREPHMPWKYKFANSVIQEWGLVAHDYPPTSVAVVKNGQMEIVNHYQNGMWRGRPTFTYLPTGIAEPVEGEPYLCGKDDLLLKPTGSFVWPWDVAFHGHKGSDGDAINGSIPLQADIVQNPLTDFALTDFVYPLREFSDADVWAYTEKHGVPYQADRYDRANGYAEFADTRNNPDYFAACVRCFDRDQPAVVTCPKDGLRKTNISAFVRYEEPLKRPYFQKEQDHGL